MKLLLDTNILLRLANIDDPIHQSVREFVDSKMGADDLVIAPQCLFEFWSVATRPLKYNGFGMPANDAAFEIRRFGLTFSFHPDPQNLTERWIEICESHNTTGKAGHDARLVAYAQLLEIDAIITLNPSDFTRYGLTVQVP